MHDDAGRIHDRDDEPGTPTEGAGRDDDRFPAWVKDLLESVAPCIDAGFLGLHIRIAKVGDDEFGADCLMLAPVLAEIVQQGPNDGAEVFDSLGEIDLLAVQRAFDAVDEVGYYCIDDEPHIRIWGARHGRVIALEIYLYPFDDAEPLDVIRTDAAD